jgi:hypothetical protein
MILLKETRRNYNKWHACAYLSIIPPLGRLILENHKYQASLHYIVRLCCGLGGRAEAGERKESTPKICNIIYHHDLFITLFIIKLSLTFYRIFRNLRTKEKSEQKNCGQYCDY